MTKCECSDAKMACIVLNKLNMLEKVGGVMCKNCFNIYNIKQGDKEWEG